MLNYFLGKVPNAKYCSSKIKCVRAKNRRGGAFKLPPPGSYRVKHSYMPQSMINSIIVPLVKNRCGNLTDKNNYRPIALSSITSKVFEHIILQGLKNIYGPLIINLVSSQAIQQTSVFMHYLNLLNISKAVPLLCILHFLTLVRFLIK